MKTEFNYFWGLLGVLGFLGYILENQIYYVFFAFFLLFLVPIFNKIDKKEGTKDNRDNKNDTAPDKSETYNLYNLSIWLGSAALIIDSLILIIWKTMDDAIAIGLLLGIMVYTANFFTYIGMEKTARDERLRKIGTMAATYSWYVTLTFVTFLLITMYWAGKIRSSIEIMGVTILVMVTTMIILNTYFNLKGDVDWG